MIRLIFSRSPELVSGAIRTLTGQPVSHVGIQYGENAVVAAEGRGVVEETPAEFAGRTGEIVACYQATPEGERHLMIWHVVSLVGQPYAFDEIKGFFWVRVARWFGRVIRNPCHDPNRWICSELVLALDDETGKVTEFIGLERETTSPGDILARLRRGGPTFVCLYDVA